MAETTLEVDSQEPSSLEASEPRSFEREPDEFDVEKEDTSSEEITEPYDPSKIRVSRRGPTISNLMDMIRHEELDMAPEFQRHGGIWTEKTQSRLIESILMGIPLPAFYFDATSDDKWLVVDGLQRLTALARFLLTPEELEKRVGQKPLWLGDLEFLKELKGKRFDDLPRRFQRDINQTQLTSYVIEQGTPEELKFNIFRRINTGGLPLSSQEIRHALNQGQATRLLAQLANSPEFKQATANGISGKRMADRECVLRFLAFVENSPEIYKYHDFDLFLSRQMQNINKLPPRELEKLEKRFLRAMKAATRIFDNDAFRKRFSKNAPRSPINKALFEAWAVNLDRVNDHTIELLVDKKEELIDWFIELNNEIDFERAISQGTGDIKKVRLRFAEIRRIIQEVAPLEDRQE